MDLIQNNIKVINDLCEKHRVNNLYAFGSILSDNFSDDSDVDLVVDFGEVDLDDYADNYFDFKDSLESLLGKQIDLLEEKAIKNPYLKEEIDLNKKLIYG